jgi:hypothetical protein
MSPDTDPRSQPPLPAQCLAVADGTVLTESHLFNLVDIEAVALSGAARRPAAPRGTQLLSVGSGALLAVFTSELEDNEPHVVVEHWSAEPPAPDGPWEVHAQERLTVEAGQLSLSSGISGVPAPHRLTLPPGHYDLAVWCRGRAAARAAELDAIDQGSLLPGLEQWLLRLWPRP